MDIVSIFLHYVFTMNSSVVFLHSGKISPCAARVDKYFEDYYSLEFISRGTLELAFDNEAFILEGPWMWVSSPGPRIRFHAQPGSEPWTHRYAAFKGSRTTQWRAAKLLPDRPQRISDPKTMTGRFDELLALLRQPDRLSGLKAINLLEHILLALAEQRTEPPYENRWLVKIMHELDSCDKKSPDYEALASRMNMGLSTLRRKFRQSTGISLHQYVLDRRVEKARQLLGETDYPVKEIAERLGYQDVYFFSRQFRQQTGIPPGEYRKSRMGFGS